MSFDPVKILYLLDRDFNKLRKNKDFKFSLESHPDYPSLKSVSDSLRYFDIPNQAVKINNLNDLYEVEGTFLAYIKTKNDLELVYVISFNESTIHYMNQEGEKVIISFKEFKSLFSGYIIILDHTAKNPKKINIKHSLEFFYAENRELISLSPLLATVAVSVILLLRNTYEFNLMLLILSKMMGIALSILLLLNHLSKYNNISKVFCGTTEKIDCNHVSNSKYGRLFNKFYLYDISLAYFIWGILLITYQTISSFNIQILYLTSLIASVYIFISLYQQAVLLKKYCNYCLAMIGVLLIETLYSFYQVESFEITLIEAIIPYLSLGGIYYLVHNLNSRLRLNKEVYEQKTTNKKILRNNSVKNALLSSNDKIEFPRDNNILNHDQKEVDIDIKIIVTLECKHCKEIITDNSSLIKDSIIKDNLSIEIIPFMLNHDESQLSFLNEYYRLLEIDKLSAFNKITEWYLVSGYAGHKSSIDDLSNSTKQILLENQNYVIKNRINRFPSVIITNRLMPDFYSLELLLKDDFNKYINIHEDRQDLIRARIP